MNDRRHPPDDWAEKMARFVECEEQRLSAEHAGYLATWEPWEPLSPPYSLRGLRTPVDTKPNTC